MTDTAQEFAALRDEMNDKFKVRIRFKSRVIGGIPQSSTGDEEKTRNLMEIWLRKRLGDKLTEEQLAVEVEKTFEEAAGDAEEEVTQTFKGDDNGLYIEGRQVKALFREAASRLGFNKAVKGQRPSLRQDIHEGLHVDEDRIYLLNGVIAPMAEVGSEEPSTTVHGSHVAEPHGHETRPIHVMGPQGPRSAIKRSAYVENAECEFTVRVLNMIVLEEDHLRKMLAFGQDLGLGADRSQGNGKFEVIGFEAV
jgi:hypothetical protein